MVLTAKRTGFTRPPQASILIDLGKNESQTIVFPAIGCKWLNAANNATLTAVTNPRPVDNEDGPAKNNKKVIAPNLSFGGNPACANT